MRAFLILTAVLAIHLAPNSAAGGGNKDPEAAGKKLSEWLKDLADKDWQKRAQAARSLGLFGAQGKPAVPALVKALKDDHILVRRDAVSSLGNIGPNSKEAVGTLIDCFDDPRLDLRMLAEIALFKIGIDALPEVAKALKHKDKNVRESAFKVVSRFNAKAAPAVAEVVHVIDDPDLSAGAVHLLRFIGAPAVPHLIEAVETGGLSKVEPGLRALGLIKTNEARAAILKARNHPDKIVQVIAAAALWKLGEWDDEHFDVIFDAVRAKEPRLRNIALQQAVVFETEGVRRLLKLLEDDDDDVRRVAMECLARIPGQTRIPLDRIITALDDSDQQIRLMAVES